MSIRMPNELTASCGASEGQEIPAGAIGGKNGRLVTEPAVTGTFGFRLGADAESGAIGDMPAQPTTSTLANVSIINEDFIRHLSLRPDEAR
jgi:hypothetical protein